MNTSNDIILIKQLPIIEEQLKLIRAEVEEMTERALGLVCTEETLGEVKKLRAELRKSYGSYEDKRKEVRRAVLAPYDAFERSYKENVADLFKGADEKLKDKIDQTEAVLKNEICEEIKAYYDEYAESVGVDFVPFERAGIKVTRSESRKKIKEACVAFLDRIASDVAAIVGQEFADEVMVEYKRSLNLGFSLSIVSARKEAIAKEREKAEKRAEAAAKEAEAESKVIETAKKEEAAVGAPEEIFELSFTVKGTLPQLKALKEFLVTGGYEYEQG